MAFASEKLLMDATLNSDFVRDLCQSPSFIMTEPKGLFGIPDFVIANINMRNEIIFLNKILAFELKLSKWKDALKQAFRYKSFADIVFVIMDDEHIRPAHKNIDLFYKTNIGLASINDRNQIFVYHQPNLDLPYSLNLRTKFGIMIYENYQLHETETSDQWIL